MSQVISSLRQKEAVQSENLISLLGTVKGSKVAGVENQVPSLVRGLCTSNQKLLHMASHALTDLQTAEDMEGLKSFVNEFILWFDANFVVFEKLLSSLSVEHIMEGKVYQQPILHCSAYVEFAQAASAKLRNPFIIDKLSEISKRAATLIDRNSSIIRKAQLEDISFDHVQTFAGKSVSCFFTPDQIVKRTEDEPLFLGKNRVEMLLLSLGHHSAAGFDSWAILRIPNGPNKRSVVYPPFRVNELFMSLSGTSIEFTSVSLDAASNVVDGFELCQKQTQKSGKSNFTITGPKHVISRWFQDLKAIFPTDDKLLESNNVQSFGLGIQTLSDSSDDDGLSSPCTSRDSAPMVQESRRSLDSCHSLEIMKKTLSSSGMEAEMKDRQLTVTKPQNHHHSMEPEYAYPDEADDDVNSVTDSLECFDMVTSKPQNNKLQLKHVATASMPNLCAPAAAPSVYMNTAGSAIDVNNFGRSHNPSFASLPGAELVKTQKKRSFLDLFRKKRRGSEKSQETLKNLSASVESKEATKKETNAVSHSRQQEQKSRDVARETAAAKNLEDSRETLSAKIPAASKGKKHPDLQIEIPKIGALDVHMSQPGSAVSTTNRTLPSPFAMPSSTSFFYRPNLNGSSAEINGSTASLPGVSEEQPYEIPQEFKDIVNAEDTLDFYISPIAPNSIKVSTWKPHCGKWELLTSNENVFLKIVANYNVNQSWLLVFKEEFDAEYDEVIDKPLLVLDLNDSTSARQSNALDIEINAADSFNKQKTHVMVRCYNGGLVQAISTNLSNILEVMESKSTIKSSAAFESSATLSSSFMSKPSTSSTLTSIFTQAEQKSTPASSVFKMGEDQGDSSEIKGGKLLLDRMTIKLHRQMESYEQIQNVSSWKPLDMYSLTISHSIDATQVGYYHFDLCLNDNSADSEDEEFSWTFPDDEIEEHIERIGKAAVLVKVSSDDLYMLECRGKKELRRLAELF